MNRDKRIKSNNWLTEGYSGEELEKMKAEAIKEAEIEEMTKVLCRDYKETCYKDCCCSHDCCVEYDCRTLYNAGYRKASEVAREIFEELLKEMENWKYVWHQDYYGYGGDAMGYLSECVDHTIAELKKRYAEGEGK